MKEVFSLLIVVFCIFFCFACNSEENMFLDDIEEITSLENSLQLKAPCSRMIAPDFLTLKKQVRARLKDAYDVENFEITKINYVPVKQKGYIACIYYLTDEGKVGNIVKSNLELKINGQYKIRRYISDKVGEGSGPIIDHWYQCIQKLGMVCEPGCALQTPPLHDSDFQCTCVDECAMLCTKSI